MKTPFKLVIAAIPLIALGLIINPSQAVQTQQEAVPLVNQQGAGQYKVIDIGQISVARGGSASGTLEVILNDAAAQGWRVAAGSGSYVIMVH